jgi:protein-disulfide isomerase
MKIRNAIVCAVAVLALAACNKQKNEGAGTAVVNQAVKMTTANPPPGGSWADVVNVTTDGYLMGNPNAKVKLIEIGALSCPHCKAFEDEGVPTLVEKYVKSGQVSWEFRPYPIHNSIDVAADLVIRCNGLKTFFPLAQALYKDQAVWMGKLEGVPQDKLQQIQDLPTNQVFIQMANVMGLQDWAAARGVPQAKSNQCLADQKMIDHEVQVTTNVTNQFPDFSGTPSFAINGTMLKETYSWDKLQPQLDAALK